MSTAKARVRGVQKKTRSTMSKDWRLHNDTSKAGKATASGRAARRMLASKVKFKRAIG